MNRKPTLDVAVADTRSGTAHGNPEPQEATAATNVDHPPIPEKVSGPLLKHIEWAPRRPGVIRRKRTVLHVGVVLGAMVVVISAATRFTPFRSPDVVLAERTWGIGRTSTSVMSGFALGRPWWRLRVPNGLARTAEGVVPNEVRIPRDEIVEFGDETTLPHRSIGYDFVLGAFTAIRSLFSSELVFDWWSVVRFQQCALVFGLLAPLIATVVSTRHEHRRAAAVVYTIVFTGFVGVQPFESRWLIDGILDSALAAPAALLAVPLLVLLSERIESADWINPCVPMHVGLVLGLFTMIRGELVFSFLLAIAAIAIWQFRFMRLESESLNEEPKRALLHRVGETRPALVAATVLILVPIAYGFANVAIHGHFVPFRLQSGQNLVEPVGEFPNPWGIEYSDEWIGGALEARGIEYVSFEADAVLTRQYVDTLAQEPMLFVRNFIARLERLPSELAFDLLGPISLPVLLASALWLGRRYPQMRAALIPLLLSIGLVLFHAWFGSPSRVLAPVRFLMVSAFCVAAASAAGWMVCRRGLSPLQNRAR